MTAYLAASVAWTALLCGLTAALAWLWQRSRHAAVDELPDETDVLPRMGAALRCRADQRAAYDAHHEGAVEVER